MRMRMAMRMAMRIFVLRIVKGTLLVVVSGFSRLVWARLVPTCAALAFLALATCTPQRDEPLAPERPWLVARPEHKGLVLSRVEREPYATILAGIRYTASRDYEEDGDPAVWDVFAISRNAQVAQANALLVWLFDDQDAAEKARGFFVRLRTDFENREHRSDIDVNMPQVLQGSIGAWDLLLGTAFFPEDEALAAAGKISEIASRFFDDFVEDEITHLVQLEYSQNNHNIRTAAALGYAAVAFPDHPDAAAWASWAFSELDFFWKPQGKYVQADGGISEGPFYGAFAWQASAALFLAMNNLFEAPPRFLTDCRTRIYSDPWTEHRCEEGEELVYHDFIRDPSFHAIMEWYVALRLPWGPLPPLADSMMKTYAGSAFLSSFGGSGLHWWAWANDKDWPYQLIQSDDLSLHHLLYLDDSVIAEEPPWTSRFFHDSGHAVFRSDWSHDARWLLLVAEAGAARKAAHNQVDGMSISLAAYGEYLLVDPGYVKDEGSIIFRVKTAAPEAHNLVLIEGGAAPDKKPFPAFGDADAHLLNTINGERIEYAEAHQDYRESSLERSVVFVEGRYFVVADRIRTDHTQPREHAWRMSGYAGYGSGGLFELRPDGARWERQRAGVDVYLACTAPFLEVLEPPFVAGEVPHVHLFDLPRVTTEHGVMDGRVLDRAPAYLGLLLPYRVDAAHLAERPLPAEALFLGDRAVAWTVEFGDATDLALVREPQADESFVLPGGLVLDTDAELVVVRLSGPRPFALIARGTRLVLDGQLLLVAQAGEPVIFME